MENLQHHHKYQSQLTHIKECNLIQIDSWAEQTIVNNPLELLFSKAKFITSRVAYDRAINPHPRDKASFISDIIDLLTPGSNLLLIDNKDDFPEEIHDIFDFRISNDFFLVLSPATV